MHIYLLNGPPRCGKDYAAVRLGTHHMKMAKRLKEATHAALGIRDAHGYPVGHAYFEHTKDVPMPELGGRTMREAYIQMSEGLLKPLLGEAILGEWLADDIAKMAHPANAFTVSDAGFAPECQVLVDRFGAENVTLIRIHRNGCNFSGDSRSYITLEGVRSIDIENHGGPEFADRLRRLV